MNMNAKIICDYLFRKYFPVYMMLLVVNVSVLYIVYFPISNYAMLFNETFKWYAYSILIFQICGTLAVIIYLIDPEELYYVVECEKIKRGMNDEQNKEIIT